MDFSEPPEHVMLRDAVGGIAAKFGHEYFAERARTGGRADELWKAVGDAGFLGGAPPRGVRRRRRRA